MNDEKTLTTLHTTQSTWIKINNFIWISLHIEQSLFVNLKLMISYWFKTHGDVHPEQAQWDGRSR